MYPKRWLNGWRRSKMANNNSITVKDLLAQITHELDRQDECIKENAREIVQLKIENAKARARWGVIAGLLGFLAGLVPTIVRLIAG